jgi:putative oxidoreductase
MEIQSIIRKHGIFFLLSIFMMSSVNKVFNFNKTLEGIVKQGLPLPLIALIIAVILQVFGYSTILMSEFKIIDKKYQNYGKISLIIFTVLTLYYYHNIFTMENQTINFMKNLGLIGGLMLL